MRFSRRDSRRLYVGILLVAIAFVLALRDGSFPQLWDELVVSAIDGQTPVGAYRVVRVVDGDTIVIRKDSANMSVRMIGLDTPETVDPRRPVQCFGLEASKRALELLREQNVRIELDPSQGEYDMYGRLLAYVYLPDGTLFNKRMIEEGYGNEYTFATPYKYQHDFKAAEDAARAEKKGLWAPGVCS